MITRSRAVVGPLAALVVALSCSAGDRPTLEPPSDAGAGSVDTTTTTPAPDDPQPAVDVDADDDVSPDPDVPPLFHVATDGSDGNGDGTEAAPWASIEHAHREVPDGAVIEVGPGRYEGEIELTRTFPDGITIRSAVRYGAELVHDDTVVRCETCAGITIEGFDVSHIGDDVGQYVIQIQDRDGDGVGGHRVTLRDNVIHDSRNNDLIKVNRGAGEIVIEGNLLYNQAGPDSHIDLNSVRDVVVRNNVLFNDQPRPGDTAAFIVVKDSNGAEDSLLGSQDIVVDGNVFLRWQGLPGAAFLAIGEDDVAYHQAQGVHVQNNLIIGDSDSLIRAAFLVKGSTDVVFANNTVTGDLPAEAYAIRLSLRPSNPLNDGIVLANNIFSDPTGTMGSESARGSANFSDSPPTETVAATLLNNLYWNGGEALPSDPSDLFDPPGDAAGIHLDPLLPAGDLAAAPVWDPTSASFGGTWPNIRSVFEALVAAFGRPATDSPAVDAADATFAPNHDIFGTARDESPDLGAVEVGGR